MRVLGIDFGDRNIGLAVSDTLGLTAQALGNYRLKGLDEENKRFFKELVRNYEIHEIVVGLPLRMDGSSGTRASRTQEFACWLEQTVNLPIVFWDERLTTQEALHILRDQKVKAKSQKSLKDRISAAIILSCYLENKRSNLNAP
jgi:putative Holliday junction resolvase